MSSEAMTPIKPRDRDAILQSLRAGVVPRTGLHLVQVGRASEVEALLADIERIADRVAERLAKSAGTPEGVDSMAYQIHNLYGAFEQLFEEVARAFENQVDPVQYHANLLRRMTLHIEGIRPAFLSESTAAMLDELRRFRHLFRHAYGIDLDPVRVADIAARVPNLRERYTHDIEAFLSQLSPA